MNLISLDTETTGLDIHHGARPYLVTICDEDGINTWWEWRVNPKTREVTAKYEDLIEIQKVIDNADKIVLQNPKFDYQMLQTTFLGKLRWDWSKIYDTLLAGHLLASNQAHDLTSMVAVYLQKNIQPYEDRVEEATREARKLGKDLGYRIARKGLPEMPSAGEKCWKYDMWLPRLLWKKGKGPREWRNVCSDYANMDSTATLALFRRQREILKKRRLWRIYRARLQVLPSIVAMEGRGITYEGKRLWSLTNSYQREVRKLNVRCRKIAPDVELPRGGANDSLRETVKKLLSPYPKIKLSMTPTKKVSLNKDTLTDYLSQLPVDCKAAEFLLALQDRQKRNTAISYMKSYRRFKVPIAEFPDWCVLYPSLNPTGSDTLRFSSQNPNEQNISKKEGFNLRYCFGPLPGRVWWSLDAKNIELRIPAYEAGEKEMIDLFEKPDKPPYFGSNHLLVFSILHPQEFQRYGAECKQRYESTLYQWTKNGNFAVQYGSVESSGTADRAYHQRGAFRKIKSRFRAIHGKGGLNDRMIEKANRDGYVETMPDKTVDPDRGYPLLCTRSRWGKVKPTVPLNYHVQGTAMWWMMRAMIRVQRYLDKLNQEESGGFYLIMQVHDELVLDFPEGDHLAKVQIIRRLMERGGDDIGVPTPVGTEKHLNNWSEGETVC